MTVSVTIRNNGPYPVNVNECEPDGPLGADRDRCVQSHSLDVDQEITVNIWGVYRWLTVIEQAAP